MKVNISAGEGLQDVLKSNLGPMGTIKMLVFLLPLSLEHANISKGWLTVLERYESLLDATTK